MTEESTPRPARTTDMARMAELSARQRQQYQQFQPTFWRRSAGADERQRAALEHAIAADRVFARVAEREGAVCGFLVARLIGAPPVYDPGGLTCFIDDFAVAGAEEWPTTGASLQGAVCREAATSGAVQAVVTCPHEDHPKRQMLASSGFTVASEWHVKACPGDMEPPRTDGTLRAAVPDDLPAMVDLSEQRRHELQSYQPVFWRKAPDSREKHLPFLAELLRREDAMAWVHERNRRVDGFLIATLDQGPQIFDRGGPTCGVDDFMVASPRDWTSTGAALLIHAGRAAGKRGASHIQVVSAQANRPKGKLLAALGFSLALEWHVKEIRSL